MLALRPSRSRANVNLAFRDSINPATCHFALEQAANADTFGSFPAFAEREELEFTDLSKFMCSKGVCTVAMGHKIGLRN